MKQEFYTHSAAETRSLAAKIASETPNGTVFALDGNLGAGKTVFASGFAAGLGITEPVSSPTFTIVQEYPWGNGKMLYHMDLYRISDSDAALAFGIDDFLFDPNAISIIEWPERAEDLYPPEAIRIDISHTEDENTRIIRIRS
ncbi:MAG: tRNA (adenosine(37)-N6)-threonylcarbamoyltransferase complex ATPase subunit type 1 TsaE [Lentisphaeria bacterium]|nr:tRNA (adenosine(37)-N6)-threonylcarbamoyltransferase complex ATPase subunit type 1 TsaE [Lentisphaeria bacterium]